MERLFLRSSFALTEKVMNPRAKGVQPQADCRLLFIGGN